MTGNEFNQKLHAGELLLGTAITNPSPIWTKLAKDLELDFVFIDSEHWPFTRNELANLCQIYGAMGIIPMVRIPHPDATLACMTLDAGAWGIVAPYVESVEQVQELVGAVKYSPLKGKVLLDGLQFDHWKSATRQYLDNRNAHRSVIVNIESIPAIENLSQLAAVPGVDALLIGPHDLSISLGIPEQYDHPLFEENAEKIIETARANGLGAGIHSWWSIKHEKALMKKGLNLLVHASDFIAAKTKLSHDFEVLRRIESPH